MIREVIFDSRNEAFKAPMGAIESGTPVKFRIKISRDLTPQDAELMVLCDQNKALAGYRMQEEQEEGHFAVFSITLPIYDRGLYFYWFEFNNSSGRLSIRKLPDSNEAVVGYEKGIAWQQSVYSRDYQVPEFIKGGSFYHIFVDRFFHGGQDWVELPGKKLRRDWGGTPEYRPDINGVVQNNDFFGGNLKGILEKLPYISSLGVSCIYLSPIFEAYSNHKYDTADYFKIDPMFGDLFDFRKLCTEAKKLGISVILDGVFSHTGSDSIYFDKFGHYGGEGAYRNPGSKYRSWYYFRPDESYESWWDFDTLPRVNKLNEDYIDFICGENGVARYWIRQGASGWRLDVADELPNHFIDRLCAAVKAERSDAIIIGEVWDDASNKISYGERKNYFQGNRLDSVMNYPLKDALIAYFQSRDAAPLEKTIAGLLENYPKDCIDVLMNNIGSHDTMRILTVLGAKGRRKNLSKNLQSISKLSPEEYQSGKKLLKKASALLFTLPGVPCLYYGDEAGMEGYADPFNRRCYPWGSEDQELISWYRDLNAFRNAHSIYKDGAYRCLLAEEGAFAFERYGLGGDHADEGNGSSDAAQAVITAVNIGEDIKILELPGDKDINGSHCTGSQALKLQENLNSAAKTSEPQGEWKDVLSGRIYAGSIELHPGALLILEKVW